MAQAGIWIRVSTGKQDEANQEPDVLRHCQDRGYSITRRYEVHDRSAFHGEQEAELQKMLMDIRTRKIDVLVAWHSDRLERRGTEALFADLRNIREAGGRFESVREPFLGETDMTGTVMTAIAGATAHQYSAHLSDQVSLAVSRNRANGVLWGNGQRGYEIVGEKYNKTLVPTEEGKLYIPQMFRRIADGESCHKVGDWLRAGPWPGISTKTVYRMIKDPIYRGTKMSDGKLVMQVPPLVDAKLWKAANARLSSKSRGRRGPVTGKSALLTGALFCPRCRKADGTAAPMYRIHPRGNYWYYRCRGHAPELKSCRNMVRLGITDSTVLQALSQAQEPWTELRHIPGENYDSDIAEVQLALHDLPKQGLSRKDEQTQRERLWAEEDRLTELNKHARPDRWEEVEICSICNGEYRVGCESAGHPKMTVGEHFASLDLDGMRAMILENVKVYAKSPDPELRKAIGNLPTISIESRLFRSPVTWVGESEAL